MKKILIVLILISVLSTPSMLMAGRTEYEKIKAPKGYEIIAFEIKMPFGASHMRYYVDPQACICLAELTQTEGAVTTIDCRNLGRIPELKTYVQYCR